MFTGPTGCQRFGAMDGAPRNRVNDCGTCAQSDFTCCFLPVRAPGVTTPCEAAGTTKPQSSGLVNAPVRDADDCQPRRARGLGKDRLAKHLNRRTRATNAHAAQEAVRAATKMIRGRLPALIFPARGLTRSLASKCDLHDHVIRAELGNPAPLS